MGFFSFGGDEQDLQPPDPFTGRYLDTDFSVESYDDETVTIEFEVDGVKQAFEIDARDGEPEAIPGVLQGEVASLLELGVDYLDIGFNTNRIAAEVPGDSVPVDEEFAVQVVEQLHRIKVKLAVD